MMQGWVHLLPLLPAFALQSSIISASPTCHPPTVFRCCTTSPRSLIALRKAKSAAVLTLAAL
jgi:hypothetical protein